VKVRLNPGDRLRVLNCPQTEKLPMY
jgi:hypothetical protein